MPKPRDNQKSRLYAAERAAQLEPSPLARRLLVDTERVPSTGSITIEACQAYLDHLFQSAWFQRRWGRRSYKARHKAYGNATYSSGWTSYISLPPWARDEWVLLHEVAHGLTEHSDCAHHGPEFAGVFLTLVEHRMGKAAGASLREQYKANRVRYNLSLVPKPTKTVRPVADPVKVPSATVAAKHRAARLERETKAAAKRQGKVTPGLSLMADVDLSEVPFGEMDGYKFWFATDIAFITRAARQAAGLLGPDEKAMARHGLWNTKRGSQVLFTWEATEVREGYWRVEAHNRMTGHLVFDGAVSLSKEAVA